MESVKGITVFCASSDNIAEVYFEAAYKLGCLIAQAGLPVINGGGRMGLMGAVSNGALDAGGEAIGVIPGFMVEKDLNHKSLTRTIVTDDMRSRKKTLADLAVGIIALPGGVGTFEELFELLTNSKLGFFDGKIVILNTAGYYDPLITMLERAEAEGFSYGARNWQVAQTPEQALQIILG